jgi:hypothetical protein
MLKLRTYGLAIQMRTPAIGGVSWSGDEIIFNGTRVGVESIISTVQSTVLECCGILKEELLYTEVEEEALLSGGRGADGELPEIPWADVLDNAADFTIGWSLVDDLLRRVPRTKGWLVRRIQRDESLRRRWVNEVSSEGISFRDETASGYGRALERFLEGLLFLVHLSSGQPARAPELLTMRFRNTADGGVRNIFMDRGLVMTVTGYHKGYSRSEELKIVHRFLPREVGSLMVYYLWLVLPFWEGIQANVWGRQSFGTRVWGGECEGESGEDEVSNKSWITKFLISFK